MRKSREAIFAEISPSYSGLLHLCITSVVGLSTIAAALMLVRGVSRIELMVVPAAFVVANGAEWLIHKKVMHRRVPLLAAAYERHALTHHVAFPDDRMEAPSRREWRWVLFPAPAILGLISLSGALSALLRLLSGSRTAAALCFATLVGFFLLYEWLHLSYHLSPDSLIGRLPPIRVLRRHHLLHHRPGLAGRYNFNITVPLFDGIMGTMAPLHKSVDSPAQSD